MNGMKPFCIVAASVLVLLSGCKKHASEQSYLETGEQYFAAGDLDKARVEFKNAARIAPSDGEPYYHLGLIDERQNNLQNAFQEYMIAVQQSPHLDPALLKLASFFFMSGQTDQAAPRIAQALSDNPTNPDARAADAALKVRRGDSAGAEAELKSVLATSPTNVTASAVLAEIYAARKDDARTAAVLNAGIAANPLDDQLLVLKVRLFDRLDDQAQVISALNALIKLHPTDLKIRQKAAEYLTTKGHPAEAESVLRDGVAIAPDDLDMKHLLVEFLDRTKGLGAAEAEIDGYLRATPNDDTLNLWLADLYFRHQQTDRAVQIFNDIISRGGVDKPALTARTALAKIDLSTGNTAAARPLIDVVLQNDPDNADAVLIKASIESDNGDNDGAASDLRSILTQHPDFAPATRLLVQVLVKQGYMSLAIDTLHSYVLRAPNDLDSQIQLAQLYAASGDNTLATKTLRDLTNGAPDFAPGWEYLARSSLANRDWTGADQAISHLESMPGQALTAGVLRGNWLAATGKPGDALAKLTSVVQAAPNTRQADLAIPVIADLYRNLGQIGQGIAFITSLHSNDPGVLTVLGQLYLAAGKPTDAATQFDQAIADGAMIDTPYIYRANALASAGKVTDAESLLQQALKKLPQDPNLATILGNIEMNSGQNQAAIALYKGMLAADPNNLIAANNYAELVADFDYGDTDALKAAEATLVKVDVSDKPVLIDTIGWVYYREGKLDLAASYLQKAATSPNAPPQVHYHYGMVLLNQGHLVDAKHELQLATPPKATYPGSDEARKALAGM